MFPNQSAIYIFWKFSLNSINKNKNKNKSFMALFGGKTKNRNHSREKCKHTFFMKSSKTHLTNTDFGYLPEKGIWSNIGFNTSEPPEKSSYSLGKWRDVWRKKVILSKSNEKTIVNSNHGVFERTNQIKLQSRW